MTLVVPNWDAVIAILIPNFVAWACIFPTIGHISNKDGTAWYQLLQKPSWVLPPFTFGPIFAYMYSSLGYASYLVYAESSSSKDNGQLFTTTLYGGHLLLTFVIANLFYKYHQLAFSFLLTVLLDGILLAITISFYQVNSYSAIFLSPIAAWQLYTTPLCYALWTLNKKKQEDYQNLKV